MTTTVRIEKLVAGGDGLARLDGRALFVPLTCPGDLVEVRISVSRRDFLRGEVTRVVESSPMRVAPPCPYYGSCGGCNFQHLSYPAQLSEKQQILLDAFERVGHISLPGVSIVPGPPVGYRNRFQFHCDSDGRPGFRGRSSSSIVPIDHCLISVPAVDAWLSTGAPGLCATRDAGGVGKSRTNVLSLDGTVRTELDRSPATAVIAGRRVLCSANVFFQSNLEMFERLIASLCLDLPHGRAADLYAGVGALSVHIAPLVDDLVAVESVREAAALAARNLSDVPHARVVDRSVEEWVKTAGTAAYNLIVVDPPRAGLSKAVRSYLATVAPAQLRYVSCDPVSLARDCGELVRAGFSIESCTVFDFYPQTSHIEALAILHGPVRAV